jgi:hypothetical protein
VAVGDEDAVEDEDPGNPSPRATAITAMRISRPANRALVRAVRLWVTPPFRRTWRCRYVWGFRYAGDMRRP